MHPTVSSVSLSEHLIQRDNISCRWSLVTGIVTWQGHLQVLASVGSFKSVDDLIDNIHTVQTYLPGGIDVVGVMVVVDSMEDDIVTPTLQVFQDRVIEKLKLQDAVIVLCDVSAADDRQLVCYKLDTNTQSLLHVSDTNDTPLSHESSISLRIVTRLTVDVLDVTKRESYMAAFDDLERRLAYCGFMLKSPETPLFLDSEQVLCQTHNASTPLMKLYESVKPRECAKKSARVTHFTHDYLDFDVVQRMSKVKHTVDGDHCVPVVYASESQCVLATIPLQVNCVAVTKSDTPLSHLSSLLHLAILRQIAQFRLVVMQFSNESTVVIPVPYRFLPPKIAHFVSVAYPKHFNVDDLVEHRRSVHVLLGIMDDRPSLRPSVRHSFVDETSYHLVNVHRHCPSPGFTGRQSITQGNYQYHHYMQDNYDDKGWGCAYRSFQTVWSWFILQGYTEKPVPTHKQIQQTLVDIGDREPNFVGSRLWIGSIELGYCLDEMLGMTSRIITASSGEEMQSKARQIAHHFDTQGTPIMIGGGVLAHTILGVYFDENTGDVKFLVLDPHFTGDEDVQTIVNKGWCGWKPVSFWEKGAFYNMLLPQRPKDII